MNYTRLYENEVGKLKRGSTNNQKLANCPFCRHPDDFSICIDTGLWHCFCCGEKGNAAQFLMKLAGMTFTQAKKKLGKLGFEIKRESQDMKSKVKPKIIVKPAVLERLAERYFQNLRNNDNAMRYLKEVRGFTDEVIGKYRIGYVKRHPHYRKDTLERLTIPISRNGKLVNIWFHAIKRTDKFKDLPCMTGLKYANWLFPEDELKNDEIYLCEGPLDALCAISHGLNAISQTTGAKSWKNEFTPLFRGKKVNIVYDCDPAGRTGAQKTAEILCGVAKATKVIDLGLKAKKGDKSGPDLTDWFMKEGKTKDDLEELTKKTKSFEKSPVQKEKEAKRNEWKRCSSKKLEGLPRRYSNVIRDKFSLMYDSAKRLWIYDKENMIWKDNGELILKKIIREEILPSDCCLKQPVSEIIADLQGLCYVNRIPQEPPPHLIPFKNKIFDLKTGKILDYNPRYFFINKLAVDLNQEMWQKTQRKLRRIRSGKEAEEMFKELVPNIHRIFTELVPEKDLITLYEIPAYGFWRGYPYQVLFVLYGSGANGKTAYLSIIERLFGTENISRASIDDIQYNRFASSELFGRMLNISGEMDYTIIRKTSFLKKLCGGDPMRAERKYAHPFNFLNYAKLCFPTNQIPLTIDKTIAFYRRIFLLEFPNEFIPGENADLMLVEKIPKEEFERLAVICLLFLKRLFKRDFLFTNHKSVEQVEELYEELSNPLNRFLDDFTGKENEVEKWNVNITDFKEKFCSYLSEKKLNIWSSQKINRVMRAQGYGQGVKKIPGTQTSIRVWNGLRWK